MKKRERGQMPAAAPEAAEPVASEGGEPAGVDRTEIALDDDDWDGPTREVAPEEVAALAIKSTGDVENSDGAPSEEAHRDDDITLPRIAVEDLTPLNEGDGAIPVMADGVEGGAAEAGDATNGDATAGEGAAATSEAEGGGPAPDAGESPGRLESVLESLLFVSDRPLTIGDLKRLTGERQVAKLTEALEGLRARREDSGIQLVPVAGGWTLRTHPENVAWVSRLIAGKPVRLSRAMLETLAIVAYRQPVTRPEIDEIRGVDCGPVLGTLLDRGLIRIIGKKEEVGRPMLYGTTPEFLRTFSLKDLNELPTLREFHELSEDHRDKLAKVEGETASGAGAPAEGDATLVQPAPLRPVVARRELDPDEDDQLLGELDRAAAAAAAATNSANPAAADGPVPEAAAPPEPAHPDEPAGSAD